MKPRFGPSHTTGRPRSNVYINPNYKPSTPALPPTRPSLQTRPSASLGSDEKRDVVIGGVAFESSGRSLVRKDCTPSRSCSVKQGIAVCIHDVRQPVAVAISRPASITAKPALPNASFAQSHAAQYTQARPPPPPGRVYKPKASRRGRPMNRNMTLTNNRRPNGYVLLRLYRKVSFS